MQKVDISEETAPCSKCGVNLTILGKFTYMGITNNTPRQKDETCKCNTCGEEFTLVYKFFDSEGHINGYVFTEDINDPSYKWQDQLTESQKKEIGEHLKTCKICNEKLINELATDAWLASVIHNFKKEV